jgi:hypothetical protein
VTGWQIEDAVERIAVSVGVVVLGIGACAARLQGFADRRKLGERQSVSAHGVVRKRATGGASDQLSAF